VDARGAVAAVVCVGVDLDDCDATTFVGEVPIEPIDVAAPALADGVEVGITNEAGCPGSVIVPERVGRAADFSPEQILYKAVVSVLSTVGLSHTSFAFVQE
jgi:hypothetical protein